MSILIRIIGNLEFKSQKELFSIDPLGLLLLSKAKNELPLFNVLIKEIIDLKLSDLFFYCELAYFAMGPDSKEFQQLSIENLSYLLQKTNDNSVKGTAHYNLGNIYRANLDYDKAIFHYFKARKFYPDYSNRPYWWREMAGLLFSKGHYLWSEFFYRKSQERNEKRNQTHNLRLEQKYPEENNLTTVLIADCLFFQGKFKQANVLFEEFITIAGSKSQEWILKNYLCLVFIKNDLDSIKIDKNASLKLCEIDPASTNGDDTINILNEAIKFNPLNGLAWFNLGIALDKKMKRDEALIAFLATGLIQDGDKEAQFNALTLSLNLQNLEMMQTITFFIIEKHGQRVINDLADFIMEKNLPLEFKQGLINEFNELFISLKIQK